MGRIYQGWRRWRRHSGLMVLTLILALSVSVEAIAATPWSALEEAKYQVQQLMEVMSRGPLSWAKAEVLPSKEAELFVNINEATAAELTRLPRIGPAMARRIIAYRAKRPFRHVRQLLRVRGIGRKTLKLLLPWCRVEGKTTLLKPPPSEKRRRFEPFDSGRLWSSPRRDAA